MQPVHHLTTQRDREEALAAFGRRALLHHDLNKILNEACVQVVAGLRVPIAKIAIRREHSNDLTLESCVGLSPELAIPGKTIVPGGKGSAMGYALETGGPVISAVETETRFEPSELVRQSGVKMSVNVILWVESKPYGSLEADSTADWSATEDDVNFLQNYANLVAAAIEKQKAEMKLASMLQERQVLLNEIFHRIKNLLANVLAIARRTAAHSRDLDEFSSAFEGRISALSRAHDLLLTAPDQPAQLRELLALEFKAKGLTEGSQFTVEGPDLLCEPRTIQALALLVFELATNAVKYGALSQFGSADSQINVSWSINDESNAVQFRWRESGVAMQNTTRRGFGSELISRVVPQMLSGEASLTRHHDGVEWVVTFPLPDTTGTAR